MGRSQLITAASFAGSLGWGTILPFQYAYVVDARHWGSTTGMLSGTMFCVGAVVAAPVAGRLADRHAAGRLAAALGVISALACLAMMAASSSTTFLATMFVFGATVTASGPVTQVLLLDSAAPRDRRRVFAYQFTSLALGMAVGAFAAGLMVDLDTPHGMWPAFETAAAGFVASSVLLELVNRSSYLAGRETQGSVDRTGGTVAVGLHGWGTYRQLVRDRQVRLLALVSVALAAGFYAQFETGLPAFALQSLAVEPRVVGAAAAVNCLVIVGLQWLVVRLTAGRDGAGLLALVGAVWVASWLLLEAAMFAPAGAASVLFLVAFAVFAVGETMYAPILGPLTAALAPAGTVGTTLGALSALRTGVSAAGPLVAGLLLALDLPHVFVLLHVAVNGAAAVLAIRLLHAQPTQVGRVDTRDNDVLRSTRV